jgi:hypothetical protein
MSGDRLTASASGALAGTIEVPGDKSMSHRAPVPLLPQSTSPAGERHSPPVTRHSPPPSRSTSTPKLRTAAAV